MIEIVINGSVYSIGRPRRRPPLEDNKRRSWQVFVRRFLVVEQRLGYVNAKSETAALERASARYPGVRDLRVAPKQEN